MRIANVTYSSEIRSWTTGAMTAGAEVMKSTNIITIKIINKMTPYKCFKNTTILVVGRVRLIGGKEFQSRGSLQK